jgi:hypothetical protein
MDSQTRTTGSPMLENVRKLKQINSQSRRIAVTPFARLTTIARALPGQCSFGYATCNSSQGVQKFVGRGISLRLAIPNHPWVDGADGAAVRIAMTSAAPGTLEGILQEVIAERPGDEGEYSVDFRTTRGQIHPDLKVGLDLLSMSPLDANDGLACPGVQLSGQGFVLTAEERAALPSNEVALLVKPYIIGKSITDRIPHEYVVDTRGFDERQLRGAAPTIYQHLLEAVRASRRAKAGDTKDSQDYAERWWQFSKTRSEFGKALVDLERYVACSRTSEHRVFTFVDIGVVAESKVLVVASDDGYTLGCLSSRIHDVYATKRGGWHGKGNSPTYNHTECFVPFPFPACTDAQQQKIRELGEALDAHRKRQQAAHPGLTITDMYNVLEKLRRGEELTDKDKRVHEQGLVSVLKQIHDDLDAAVAEAYRWPADLTDEQILQRLVALNHERAEEERRGLVRWLRPDFQNPAGAKTVQGELAIDVKPTLKPKAAKAAKPAWPKGMAEQAQAVRAALASRAAPASAEEVAKAFKGANLERVRDLLETLGALGQIRRVNGERFAA